MGDVHYGAVERSLEDDAPVRGLAADTSPGSSDGDVSVCCSRGHDGHETSQRLDRDANGGRLAWCAAAATMIAAIGTSDVVLSLVADAYTHAPVHMCMT